MIGSPDRVMNSNGSRILETASGVSWTDAAPCSRHILRADAQQIALVAEHYGWPNPERMLRASRAGDCASLWLGPDEWLLLGPFTAPFRDPLRAPAFIHSLVDISERQLALELAGPAVEDLLASACPLDLGIDAFRVDDCTRTIFGRSEIVLWRTGLQRFRLECWRSYLPYLRGLLQTGVAP